MALSKAAKKAIKAITKLQSAPITETYQLQRIAEDATSRLTIASPQCRIDNTTVPMSDGYDLPLRIFTPLDIDFSFQDGLHVNEDFRGTIIFFHGGGWANGDINFYTDACMRTALKLERRVVAVEYRRSPENPFPIGLADCYEATRALFAGDVLSDISPEHIVLMGDSAGGNLTAAVTLLAKRRQEFSPNTAILLYPLLYNDHSETTKFESVRENGEGFILTREDIEGYCSMYLYDPADQTNDLYAPLLAPDLSGLPRTLIITGEYDPLRDEGEAYAARLASENGQDSVACYRMIDGIHGYFLYPSVLSLVRDTYAIIKHFLDGTPLETKGKEQPWLKLDGIA